MKNKAPLKERNPYKYHRNRFLGFKTCKWLSILAPFVTLFIVKFQDYFVVETETTQINLSLGCILALAVGGIVCYQEMMNKPKEKETEKNQVKHVLNWAIAFVFVFLFHSILNDLLLIVGCGMAGQLAGLGFELGAIYQNNSMKEHLEMRKHNEQLVKLGKAWGQLNGKHPPIN